MTSSVEKRKVVEIIVLLGLAFVAEVIFYLYSLQFLLF